MKTILALTVASFVACNPFVPPKSCHWKHTAWAVRTDTIYNKVPIDAVPDSLRSQWRPYYLLEHLMATDSARICD